MRARLFWLVIGAGLGYLILRRIGVVRSSPSDLAAGAARQVSARAGEGVAATASNAIAAARTFTSEVRAHAAEREALLRAAVAPTDDEPRPDITNL